MSLTLDTHFVPAHGEAVPVAPNILRITAPNAGPMTFHGTNSYVVGSTSVVVIDPGPDDPAHLQTLLAAIAGRPVDAILATHTHLDHTGLAHALAAKTGAPLIGEGIHRTSRSLREGERNLLDAAADRSFVPDRRLTDREVAEWPAGRFRAVATPGHTANHMAFALEGTGLLFSGDHVMAWATSVVAPPDGRMADFMTSLDRLLERDDTTYLPGHGGPVERPQAFVRALRTHRRMREGAILARIRAGDRTIPAIVAQIYRSTDPRLHGAAGLSVLAHLEDLAERGLIATEGPVAIDAVFTPA
ncbi:MBL fold metallo-hydrolase [Aureimonas sp. AU12]|uniref:MBL fold metallo-hydrolase n=1 Tax=Aureimonas sp. AU12 TaxID=1638161 RepID=UPI00078646E8|nr:MBL fold metallo-hydrolase [Aureimonas sp. AU12]